MDRSDTNSSASLLTIVGLLGVLIAVIVILGGELMLEDDSAEDTSLAVESVDSEVVDAEPTEEAVVASVDTEIDDQVAFGAELYQINCASCHGANDGAVQANLVGPVLLNNAYLQENDDATVLQMLINGRAADDPANVSGIAMPARGGNPRLTDDDLVAIVAYLRSIEDSATATDESEVANDVDSSNYTWEKVVGDFDNPTLITTANDGTDRIFVMEQTGFILVAENGTYRDTPFLDVSALLPLSVYGGSYTEQGLLGLAFHPNYIENGQFFISYTDVDGTSVIARYTVSADDPNVADANSAEIILTYPQPFEDHNGGHLAFGPDGYLYMGFGDGGRPAEPNYFSQEPDTLLGKMIRIDVDSASPYAIPDDNPFVDDPNFRPEIWALGLRNPWRFSFDRATGDLWIADVGQWRLEEVNYQPADSTGGQNYGWSAFEATDTYLEDETLTIEPHAEPVLQYEHDEGCSVTGGHVYRGEAMPELQGMYIYGDYCSGRVWTASQQSDGTWQSELFMETGFIISSFGEDNDGELLLLDYKGGVYRLVPQS